MEIRTKYTQTYSTTIQIHPPLYRWIQMLYIIHSILYCIESYNCIIKSSNVYQVPSDHCLVISLISALRTKESQIFEKLPLALTNFREV